MSREVENASVICLKSTKQAWDFESSILERKASHKDDGSSAKSLANFAINNPAVFAPISMILAGGVNVAGGAISMVINKGNIEAETRRRVLADILNLDGSSLFDLNWAQLLEVRHYVGWFVREIKQRHKITNAIDLGACEHGETELILGILEKYESIIKELDEFLVSVSKEISSWEKLAEKEYQDLEIFAKKERLNYLNLIEGVNREIKNVDLKKDAHLIDEKEYELIKQGLDDKLREIKDSHKCNVLGCGDLKAPMADYCTKHRCKVPGCTNCVEVVEGLPVVLGSILRAASTVVGNANTKHIMEVKESFCAEHGADLSKESRFIEGRGYPSENENSTWDDKSSSLSPLKKIAITMALIVIVYIAIGIIGHL